MTAIIKRIIGIYRITWYKQHQHKHWQFYKLEAWHCYQICCPYGEINLYYQDLKHYG